MWALEKDFWTSGTSTGCAGTFEWCSKNSRFASRESMWRDGHPVGEEACVTIALFDKISDKKSSLASSLCQEIMPFICEATNLFLLDYIFFVIFCGDFTGAKISNREFAEKFGVR
jgi:hypothetical protein